MTGFEWVVFVLRVVDHFLATHPVDLDVRLMELALPPVLDGPQCINLRIETWLLKKLEEVVYVEFLAWLSDPIAFGSEALGCIKLHNFLGLLEESQEEEEGAYDGSCPSLSVVAVKHCNPVVVLFQEGRYFVADAKEGVEGRGLVVFPFVAADVLEFFVLDAPPADVDGDVFVLMCILEKLPDGVD